MPRTALLTGTSSGLGLRLAARGFTVIATMRDLAKQEPLAEAAREAGVEVQVKQLDVQDMASIERCVAEVIAETGQIDVLVNNAGAGFVRSTEQATEEEIQWVLDVNLTGVIRCTKAVIPHMREARAGHIVNVSSVGGLVGQPFNELYCAAKFAVEGYTEGLASYLTPGFGLYFTAIEPGGIRSEFATSALEQFSASGGMREDAYKPLLQQYMATVQARAASGEDAVYQTSEEVAAIIADCIESNSPPVRLRTSEWAEELCHLKTGLDPDGTKLRDHVASTFLGA